MNTSLENRYVRHLVVESFGLESQKRLMNSTVGVVGCGALGSMVAMQLAGAGIGRLIISDFDKIDLSNLHRQLFFSSYKVGVNKCESLKQSLSQLNPEVHIDAFNLKIEENNFDKIFGQCDYIVDATDNYQSKVMIEKCCSKTGKVCGIGGVKGFHGQVMTIFPGQDIGFESLFLLNEAELRQEGVNGVMTPTPVFCASILADEAIKTLCCVGETLRSKIFIFDLLTNTYHVMNI